LQHPFVGGIGCNVNPCRMMLFARKRSQATWVGLLHGLAGFHVMERVLSQEISISLNLQSVARNSVPRFRKNGAFGNSKQNFELLQSTLHLIPDRVLGDTAIVPPRAGGARMRREPMAILAAKGSAHLRRCEFTLAQVCGCGSGARGGG